MSPTLVTFLTYGFLVLLAAGIGAAGVLISMSGRNDISERISTYAYIQEGKKPPLAGQQQSILTQFRYRMNNLLSVFYSRELNVQLITANWPITQTEYILIRYVICAALILRLDPLRKYTPRHRARSSWLRSASYPTARQHHPSPHSL
jgi:hypothetical protein